MKIAFEGIQGAHTQAAIDLFVSSLGQSSYPAHPLFPRESLVDAKTVACRSLDDICAQLTATPPSADVAFIPIENSQSGTFLHVYDSLLKQHNRVHIVGEWVCHQSNCLMVLPDCPIQGLADIQELYSHQHVLDQCQTLVKQLHKERNVKQRPGCLVRAMENSAFAAQWLQEQQLKQAAVIGNRKAAEAHGLKILQAGVEDDKRSATRYLIVSGLPLTHDQLATCSQTSTNKTSIAVALKNAPGQLFRALACFALRDVNITKMESRPSPRAANSLTTSQGVWEYVNYMDVECGLDAITLRNALNQLQEFATQVRVLGSYPRFSGVIDVSSPVLDSPMGYMSM